MGLNGCVLAHLSQARPPHLCVPATCLPVWWDDVYNNGERQSNFTQHASHRQPPLLAAPAPHLKRDEIENNTNFMYRATQEEAESVVPQTSIKMQFHLGRVLVKIKKYHCCFLCLILLSSLCFPISVFSTLGVSLRYANTFSC